MNEIENGVITATTHWGFIFVPEGSDEAVVIPNEDWVEYYNWHLENKALRVELS